MRRLQGGGHRPRESKSSAVASGNVTDAERTVIALVGEGLTNKEIAGRLFVAPSTVHWHLKNIFRKLGVQNRTQLALKADELTRQREERADP